MEVLERKLYRFIEECLKRKAEGPVMSEKLGSNWYSSSGSDIVEEVRVRSRTFSSSGIGEGFKVVLIMKDGVEWFINMLSILKLGATVIPLSTAMPREDIMAVLDDAKAEFVVVDEDNLPICPELFNRSYTFKLICSKRGLFEEMKAGSGTPPQPDPALEDVPVIIYTSGTMGGVKGVMLTDDNIIYCVEKTWEMGGFSGTEKTLNILPFCHAYGFTCGLLSMVYGGVHVYISSGIRHLKDDLGYVRPSLFIGVPLIYQKIKEASERNLSKGFGKVLQKAGVSGVILKKKLTSLFAEGGSLYSGGAPIDPDTVDFFERLGFNFLNGYGLTETSPVVSMETREFKKKGSVGRPLEGTEVKIVDTGSDGVGEIAVKGPGVMKGYYKREDETSRAFSDGWFLTGDVGYLDEDGFLFVLGRRKNLMVTPEGKNVAPEEIEALILNSPLVDEVLVRLEEEVRGRSVITAIVLPNMDVVEGLYGKVDEGKLLSIMKDEVKRCTSHLPAYKRVKKVSIRWEEFPKTYTKKIKRHEV